MNDDYLSLEDQRLLDLLVDGELSDAERRELLLRLERSPDGWRRCAAAFLEAQAWRSEARAMVTAPAPAPAAISTVRPASAASRPPFQIWMPLALAAGLLVAVGWVVWNRNPGAIGPNSPAPTGVPVAKSPAPNGMPSQLADSEPNVPATPFPNNLHLVVNGGPEGRRSVEVPIVDAARMNEALFGQWSQSLPPEVIRLLEQNGHQVMRERRLVPVDLGDGRRVVVPMDQVEIRPVNMQFQ